MDLSSTIRREVADAAQQSTTAQPPSAPPCGARCPHPSSCCQALLASALLCLMLRETNPTLCTTSHLCHTNHFSQRLSHVPSTARVLSRRMVQRWISGQGVQLQHVCSTELGLLAVLPEQKAPTLSSAVHHLPLGKVLLSSSQLVWGKTYTSFHRPTWVFTSLFVCLT